MDVLADVLGTIRLSANTYFCTDFAPPWGLDIDGERKGVFHAVVRGECWLDQSGAEPVRLREGDIIAFPTGGAHRLTDCIDGDCLPGETVVSGVLEGRNPFAVEEGRESATTLLCGSFAYDTAVDHPFLKDLPCFIHLRSADLESGWLRALIMRLADESLYPKPGSAVMIDRLTEALFVQLMRSYMDQAPGNMRYMAALGDPKIGSALNMIHTDDSAGWTVENLADKVAMSRTAFSERFTRAVGQSPKSYMINWRMQRARRQLISGDRPMIDIAESAGYSSEAAFGKAYKQFFGDSPGAVRRAS